jgi:hypothetical protein
LKSPYLRWASCERCVSVTDASWSQRLWRDERLTGPTVRCWAHGPAAGREIMLFFLHDDDIYVWLCLQSSCLVVVKEHPHPRNVVSWLFEIFCRLASWNEEKACSKFYHPQPLGRTRNVEDLRLKITDVVRLQLRWAQKWLVRIHVYRCIKRPTFCNSHVYQSLWCE